MSTPQTPGAPQHSPLPWELEFETEYGEFGSPSYTYLCGILAADGLPVFRFDDEYENDRANAALIVEAVNAHARLVAQAKAAQELAAAARTALNILESYTPISGSSRTHFLEAIGELRPRLAAWDAAAGTPAGADTEESNG